MSDWFIVESIGSDGVWRPVSGSGSKTREHAERVIDSMRIMMPHAKSEYRVARYVRDDAGEGAK